MIKVKACRFENMGHSSRGFDTNCGKRFTASPVTISAIREASGELRLSPGGIGMIKVKAYRFGGYGAVHEASLRIARNGCRLRLSPFRQFVKPRMNCTCFREV